MFIRVVREKHNCTETTTPGVMYVDGYKFGYTLEDAWRAPGVKVYGSTCIPAGLYKVEITFSNRFQKLMPLIYNTPDKAVEADGIRFTGVRAHGGNTHHDTEGCILVADNRVSNDKIYSSLSDELIEKIMEAESRNEEVWLHIE